MTLAAPVESAVPDAESPAVHSLRTRLIEHYRQPFDQLLQSPEARAELGERDLTFVVARLLGPIIFLRLTGMRPPTSADGEHIVDDFLTVHSSLSRVMGRSRTRLPVACRTALATAAEAPVMPTSPMPSRPSGVVGSGSSR